MTLFITSYGSLKSGILSLTLLMAAGYDSLSRSALYTQFAVTSAALTNGTFAESTYETGMGGKLGSNTGGKCRFQLLLNVPNLNSLLMDSSKL